MAGVAQPVVVRSPSVGRARCYTPQPGGSSGRLSPGPARRGLQLTVSQNPSVQSQHCLRQQTYPQALASSPRPAAALITASSCASMPDTAKPPGFVGTRLWSTPQMHGLPATARSDIRLQVAAQTAILTADDSIHLADDSGLQKSGAIARPQNQQSSLSWCPPATARACGPATDSTVSWCPPVTARGDAVTSWCPPPTARGLECSSPATPGSGGLQYAGSLSARPQSPSLVSSRGHHLDVQVTAVCSPVLDGRPLSVRANSPLQTRPVNQFAPPPRMGQSLHASASQSVALPSSVSYSPPPQQPAVDTQAAQHQQQQFLLQQRQQEQLQHQQCVQQQELQQHEEQQHQEQQQQAEPVMPASSPQQPLMQTSASQPGTRSAGSEEPMVSPRDTVWKRYFSPGRVGQPGPARPRDSPALQARLLESLKSTSTAPLPTMPIATPEVLAVAMASPQPGAATCSPMGIPRLPLDSGVAYPVECNPSYLPPTVRNHAGHESRPLQSQTQPTLSLQVVDPDARQALGNAGHSLLDSDDPQAQWSTPTLPPMTARHSDGTSSSLRTTIQDLGPGLCETTNSLARTMGHYGLPEPPTAAPMHPGASNSLTPTKVHASHAEISALPDEYEKQSFVVAGTAFAFAQGESFLQPSPHKLPEQQYPQPSPKPQCMSPLGHYSYQGNDDGSRGVMEAQGRAGGAGENNIHEKAADDIERAFMDEGQVKPLHPRMRALPGNSGTQSASDVRKENSCAARHSQEGAPERSPSRSAPSRQASVSSRGRQRPAPEKAADRSSGAGTPAPGGSDELSIAAAAISMRDVAELRSFRNPPAVVSQVLEAVAVLVLGPEANAFRLKRLMDHGLLAKLRAVNPAKVTTMQAERLKVLLAAPPFSDGALSEKCPAAVSLANWCIAADRCIKQTSSDPARTAVLRPDLDGLKVEPDLWSLTEAELSCVHGLRFSRDGVGSVAFHGETDCRELLDHIADTIILQPGEVVVYPNAGTKPPIGRGLNKSADITLCGCMPKTPGFKDRKAKEKYKRRVRQMTEDKGAEFIDYDCDCGLWQFRVKHF